ncbi:DNA packaging protein [Salmonella enterica subsp. enterica]|nr:DNA packaging protein [Salmonella enterica subsp. enterica]
MANKRREYTASAGACDAAWSVIRMCPGAPLNSASVSWNGKRKAEAEHLPAVENDSDESIVPPGIGQRSERVLIRALRTLHICAIDPDSNRELDMVMAETRRVFRNTMWTS